VLVDGSDEAHNNDDAGVVLRVGGSNPLPAANNPQAWADPRGSALLLPQSWDTSRLFCVRRQRCLQSPQRVPQIGMNLTW
jgi:hypothetical protein